MSVSGFFSATFPLTFAYISDCVDKKKRAPAYGLALATFGLSFCLGPISGSYLASQFGNWAVFLTAFVLVVIDVVYIIFVLPETVKVSEVRCPPLTPFIYLYLLSDSIVSSLQPNQQPISKLGTAMEYLPNTWNFQETFRVFRCAGLISCSNLCVRHFMRLL
jgi:MFS family permease